MNETAIVRAACAVVVLASVSTADADEGFYGSIGGLLVMATDTESSATGRNEARLDSNSLPLNDGAVISSDASFDTGFGFLAAFGYGGVTGLRVEIELGYRVSNLDSLEGADFRGTVDTPAEDGSLIISEGELVPGRPSAPAYTLPITERIPGGYSIDGKVDTLSLMANGVYVFDTGYDVRPYAGVGVGLARHDVTIPAIEFDVSGRVTTPRGYSYEYDYDRIHVHRRTADDIVLAYQAMLGLAWPVSESAEIRFGYRYFGTRDGDFNGVTASYDSHNFEFAIAAGF